MITVEVVYCPQPGVADRVALRLPDGSTLADALRASGLLDKYAFDAADAMAGIWGRKEHPQALLRERDRVELYRPLQCDPKEARRLRYRQRPAAKKALSGNPPR